MAPFLMKTPAQRPQTVPNESSYTFTEDTGGGGSGSVARGTRALACHKTPVFHRYVGETMRTCVAVDLLPRRRGQPQTERSDSGGPPERRHRLLLGQRPRHHGRPKGGPGVVERGPCLGQDRRARRREAGRKRLMCECLARKCGAVYWSCDERCEDARHGWCMGGSGMLRGSEVGDALTACWARRTNR